VAARRAKTVQTPGLAWSIGVLPARVAPRPQVALLVVAALAASLVVVSPPLHPAPALSGAGAKQRVAEGYGNLPISFESNVGQAPGRYDFLARGQSFAMAINATGTTLALGTKVAQDLVRVNLVGASRSAHPRGLDSLRGKVNYFIGNDPSTWHSDVATFGRVAYRGVFPGIDVSYHGNNAGTLEYDFVVAPGADPKDIRLKFSGASDVALRDGSLVITTAYGAVTQQAPVLYQTIGGRRVPIDGRFSLASDEVGFEVGAYDHHHLLVIDPTLIYSTYLGGSGDDSGQGIAVDGHGSAYVTGSTGSTIFPTLAAFQGSNAGQTDAFVTKLDASGQTLIYSTYFGGSKIDIGYGIAVDETGAAYVTGSTTSANFPVQAPFQGSNAGGGDAFVTKLNATGSALIYSTYLGGSSSVGAQGIDIARGIAVDAEHAAYVTGSTSSEDFPTRAPLQGSNAGGGDVFVTKLNDKGSALKYSTYLGGKVGDFAYGIAVDGEHAAYVTGSTSSLDFPTQAPFQASTAGSDDAFVTKLNATGSALVYSTYLGGSNGDAGYGIAIDEGQAAYVTGSTSSTNFPTTPTPFQGSSAGSDDAFVTKLNATGSTPVYSTYLGGSSTDNAHGIAVSGAGEAYVTGATSSTNFPMQAPLPGQASNSGSFDAFVTKLTATGAMPIYSTYLGGSSRDLAQGIAVDGSGAYVTGQTSSTNFPALAPLQGSNAGAIDAFVTKLGDAPATCGGHSVTIQVTAANQTTSGTAGADVIRGTAGIDTINGLGGNDTICGLGGDDHLDGGSGRDRLYGNDGNDELTVGTAAPSGCMSNGNNCSDDYLSGGAGKDTLFGFGGADILDGDGGNDTLNGGNGDDQLNGGLNRDTLYGGINHDTLHGDAGDDALYGEVYSDHIYGDGGDDYLYGGNDGINDLYGGAGNDYLYGGHSVVSGDTLYGNDGNDHLYGAAGYDILFGGGGTDHLNGGNTDANHDYCDGGPPPTGDTGTGCEVSINIP
jgi:Ca2+-binding RTX toxin-like protein